MEKDVKVKNHERFDGVYWVFSQGEKKLATKNFTPKKTIYNEKLVTCNGIEYRLWDPYRSKLSAFILKNGVEISVKPGLNILYLGAGSGTTVSHVSDIVGALGKVYSVEFSARVMRVLLNNVSKDRRNIYPLLADARFPEKYPLSISEIQGVYCDVAQPEQAKLLIENVKMYLENEGFFMIAFKARSIDVTKSPDDIFKKEAKILTKRGLEILQIIKLEPYDKDHAMVIGKKANEIM